jgi:hypothetical protein
LGHLLVHYGTNRNVFVKIRPMHADSVTDEAPIKTYY